MSDRPIRLRPATAADAGAVGELHAVSWGSAYRGILTDAFLDGPMPPARRAVWRERLAEGPLPGMFTTVADDGERLCGFVCLIADEHPRWGSLVDNLHVLPGLKRQGLGRRLMAAGARSLPANWAATPVYLRVFEDNRTATAFYASIGGNMVERRQVTQPDGTVAWILTYLWDSPQALYQGAGGEGSFP